MRQNWHLMVAMILATGLSSCGGNQGSVSSGTANNSNPVPSISSISPASVQSGGPDFTLVVNGSGFVPSSVVQWNGSNRTTTFANNTQLSATITSADRNVPANVEIDVSNPGPGGGVSNQAAFTVMSPPVQGIGVMMMISTAVDGTPGNGNSYTPPAISASGRYVAFQSDASNIVSGAASGFTDIYVRDTCIGAPAGCSPTTARVSVATDGSLPNGNSRSPSISADGRYVAFDSSASNLVPGDTNGQSDVFIRDTCIGASSCVPTTFRVSVSSDGSEADNDSRNASISASGRYVSFYSLATNLVPDDSNGYMDIFVRDTCLGAAAGCVPSTSRVSVASDGAQGNSDSFHQAISGNGRFVAFKSFASNLVTGDTNGQPDVFVRDTCAGAIGCMPSTVRVSVANDGTQANDHLDLLPAIDFVGRMVSFTSFATNLVANDTNGVADVFVRDTCGSAQPCTPSTFRASVAFDGSQANNGSTDPALSADGRYVAFDSLATKLVPGGTSAPKSVFVRDTCFGATSCSPTTILVSCSSDGSIGNGESLDPALNSNGQYVVFLSNASNLLPSGSNGNYQVWLARVY